MCLVNLGYQKCLSSASYEILKRFKLTFSLDALGNLKLISLNGWCEIARKRRAEKFS